MRPTKLSLAVVAMVGVLLGLGGEALAGGGAESCLVTSMSLLAGRQTITGAAVVELIKFDFGGEVPTADRADATLTLSYQNKSAVFRAHLPGAPTILVVSPEDVMCEIINANPKATVFVDGVFTERTIFEVFGLPTPVTPSDSLKLCLVVEPNSQTATCQSIQGLDFNQIPGTESDFTGAGSLVIYFFN